MGTCERASERLLFFKSSLSTAKLHFYNKNHIHDSCKNMFQFDEFIKGPYDHLVFLTVLTVKKSLLPLHLALAAVRAKASQEKFSSHLFFLAR